jgi:hypothetical protein
MNKIRNRAAQIRSRWLRTGLTCELSLAELEPLFSVYGQIPKGKVIILNKSKPISIDNLKSFTHDEYETHKLNIKALSQAKAHYLSLKRFNQPILVSVKDIYNLIRNKLHSKKKRFSLKDPNQPLTLDNLTLITEASSEHFKKLRRNADRKLNFWRQQNLKPEFGLSQLTELMENVGYETSSSLKGLAQRQRIRIIDKSKPITLDNIEILVKADDKYRICVS